MGFAQKITEYSGIPSLAVEIAMFALIAFIIVIIALVVLAIFRMKTEIIKVSYATSYIARSLDRIYKDLNLLKEHYDFRPGEWREDTKYIVLELLQQGKSYNEIIKEVNVSQAYIDLIERLEKEKGALPKESDEFSSE